MPELQDGYYSSPRWSWEILDCAMPMTFDTYSNCAHQCVYCFAYFQRAVGASRDDYLAHKVRSVDVERVKRMFIDPDKYAGQFAWYIKNKMVLQWGGLSDGFDWYERKFRKSLELLRFFCEIDYPISISTKGVWFVYDDEYRAVLRDAKNVHFKYSIITTNNEHAAKLEAGTPKPADRFKAIRDLNDLGIGVTTVRYRTYVLGVSDLCVEDIMREAAKSGAYSITTEFLCLESRASNHAKHRYDLISQVCGFDVFDFYRQNSAIRTGLLRLNYDVKRPHIDRMRELADYYGVAFFVSDAHHKESSAGTGCCGLPDTGPLSNINRGQYSEAMQIAKKNNIVYWSDIAPKAEGLKNIPFYAAEGFNAGGTRARVKRAYQSMFDYMRDVWNDPKSAMSPARYFGGALVPSGVDENGDIVYLYNRPYIEEGHRVGSAAELASMLKVYRDKGEAQREDGAAFGHVAFPVFVPSRGRADIATTPKLLDASRIPYTLVVEPHEESDYRAAFPTADILVLPESHQGVTYVRQFILDYAREEGYSFYWQLDDNITEFRKCGNGKSAPTDARSVLSAIEGIANRYENVALAAADYQQFAFRSEKEFSVNTRAYCCVLTRADTGVNYRPELEMKEDFDFCVQHLAQGWCTLLVHTWAMDKVAMGQNKKGGLSEKYRAGLHSEQAKRFAEAWPGLCTIKDKGERGLDVSVRWKEFNNVLRPATFQPVSITERVTS